MATSSETQAAPKLEKADGSLQYDEVLDLNSDPAPRNGPLASSTSNSDEDGEAIKKNPFLNPDVAERWGTVYENAEYECRHVFDPSFT